MSAENESRGKLAGIKEKLSGSIDKAKATITEVASREEAKAVIDWSKKAAAEVKDVAIELGSDLKKSDMGRAAAKGAVAGAVAGVPLPIVGPISGAVIGAAAGAYLNIAHGVGGHPKDEAPKLQDSSLKTSDPAEIAKTIADLEHLRKDGALTDEEFQQQKAKLLSRI